MLRLLSAKAQGHLEFWKSSKPWLPKLVFLHMLMCLYIYIYICIYISGLDIGACPVAPGKKNLWIIAVGQVKTASCLPHWESTFCIFQVYFWECVQVSWSAIQACPRKYAYTWQNHVLLGFQWNIIKLSYTIFQGQVKVGVGQVKIESHLPHGASRCKS